MMISCTSYSAFPVRDHDRIFIDYFSQFPFGRKHFEYALFFKHGEKNLVKTLLRLFPIYSQRIEKNKKKDNDK